MEQSDLLFEMNQFPNIIKPTLLIDEHICKQNIRHQIEKAKQENVEFRPHFKTHQSHEIGRWYRELGVEKITVSSLQMAAYFAEDGWQDITVAFPLNILEHELINALAASIQLNLLLSVPSALGQMENIINHPVGVFIELDTGQKRTGFLANDTAGIKNIIDRLKICENLHFTGFLTHAGHSYRMNSSPSELQKIHKSSLEKIKECIDSFSEIDGSIIVSVGDTPTFSVATGFEGVDEVRPGNAVFYDLTQHYIGACSKEDIAVQIACPVVAVYPEREEFIVYGGAVHFSKDSLTYLDGTISYGELITLNKKSVKTPYKLIKLSQEHGTVKADQQFCEKLKIGDIVSFLPVHSCLTANIMPFYVNKNGKIIKKFSYK